MKSLSRNEVLRWVSGQQSQGGSGGGGGSVDLAGYATQIWTEQNYVNKEFFSSLFKAYDANGNEVLPNDTESTIDNIKAMFGFWTDFYISALGNGGQQSVGLRLAQLADVNVAGVTNGQVLTYSIDPTTQEGKWIASTPQSGTDMATVWNALASSDSSHQIDYSHLSGAISISNGTITIGSQSITPVSGNFLSLDGGAMNNINLVTNMNADLLDGLHESSFLRYRSATGASGEATLWTQIGIKEYHNALPESMSTDSYTYGAVISLPGPYSRFDIWCNHLSSENSDSIGGLYYRSGWDSDKRSWRKLIDSGNIGSQSVNSANSANFANYVYCSSHIGSWRLSSDWDGSYFWLTAKYDINSLPCATAYATSAGRLRDDSSYTAWGQTFWSNGTPNSISGAMSSVTNIDAIAYFDTSNSRLGIGTNAPSNTLHVNGTARVSSLYIGNILITADSSGIYVSNGGLSANTYVTALGQGSQSSSIYLSQLGDVNTSGASNGQALVYRGGTWVPETISGGGGSYLPLSGGTMTGTIVTPDNDNEGIIPAANNYGQVGSSSRYYYRMYATTYYGTTFVGNLSGTAASASALTNAGRATLISSNNEFNFLSASSPVTSLHFNYKSASGGNTSTAVAEYSFDNGQGTTLAYLNSTGAHAGSDIRRKNIKEYFALAVDDIADAPVIKYTWKDINDGLHAGSVAQYWQQVLPECVGKHGSSEYLSMNYADIALVSVISLAREVVRLRREIENLTHNKAA